MNIKILVVASVFSTLAANASSSLLETDQDKTLFKTPGYQVELGVSKQNYKIGDTETTTSSILSLSLNKEMELPSYFSTTSKLHAQMGSGDREEVDSSNFSYLNVKTIALEQAININFYVKSLRSIIQPMVFGGVGRSLIEANKTKNFEGSSFSATNTNDFTFFRLGAGASLMHKSNLFISVKFIYDKDIASSGKYTYESISGVANSEIASSNYDQPISKSELIVSVGYLF